VKDEAFFAVDGQGWCRICTWCVGIWSGGYRSIAPHAR